MATGFNADLVDDVARQRFVVFVGAGASKWAEPTGGGKFKDWVEFLSEANKKVKNRRIRDLVSQQISQNEYLFASELLKENLDNQWQQLLSQEFQQAAEVSRLHKAIINLKPRIIITTNFDKLIEAAWTSAAGTSYPTVITGVGSDAFKLFRNDDKYLIKLHGSIDNPESVVFDKSSYQSGAFNNGYYADILTTLLLTHTFIFIGFSMNDPAISMLVEKSAYKFPATRPHYIFQSGKSVPELDAMWRRLRKLYVLRYAEKDRHKALADQIEQLGAAAAARRSELVASKLPVK